MNDLNYIENLEEHPAHLMLNQITAGIYIELLAKEIVKWEGVLLRAQNYRYESIVKKEIKMQEINKKLSILNGMLNDMKEQTAW